MAIRNIRKEGDEILRVKCKTVREINDGIRRLIEDMFETMYATDGVGLAAPQIGIVRQIVVIDDRNGGIFTLINPKITKEEGEQESCEGCLSLPGYRGTVKRPQKVTVECSGCRWKRNHDRSRRLSSRNYVPRNRPPVRNFIQRQSDCI